MLNSRNTLDIVQTGDVKSRPARKTTGKIPKGFIVPTITEGDGRTLGLTLTTALRSVIITIQDGDTEMSVIVTRNIWSEDWGNKPLRNSNSERFSSRRKMTSSP